MLCAHVHFAGGIVIVSTFFYRSLKLTQVFVVTLVFGKGSFARVACARCFEFFKLLSGFVQLNLPRVLGGETMLFMQCCFLSFWWWECFF